MLPLLVVIHFLSLCYLCLLYPCFFLCYLCSSWGCLAMTLLILLLFWWFRHWDSVLGMELPLKPMAFPSVSSLLVVPGTLGQLKLLRLVHQLVLPLWDLDLGLPSREIGDLTVYWHSLAGGALSLYEGPSMRYAYSLITNGPTSSFVLPCHLGDQGRHALYSFKATGIMPMRQRSITPRLDTPIELRHNIEHAPLPP